MENPDFVSDNGYWQTIASFTPNNFSTGIDLRIWAHWLWDDQDFALNTGYHVPGFIDFQSIEQFEPAIRQLARRAEQKVTALQQTHGSIRETADILAAAEEALLAQGGGVGWPHYHAAIACGLAGGTEAALWMFDRVLTVTSDGGGAPDIRCKSAALARLLRKDPSHA